MPKLVSERIQKLREEIAEISEANRTQMHRRDGGAAADQERRLQRLRWAAGGNHSPADRVGAVSTAQRHPFPPEPLQQLSLYRALSRTPGVGRGRSHPAPRSRKP